MTATFTSTIRQAALVLGFAALTSTSSFAFSSEARQLCTGDALRLCSSEIPNIPAITACMIKNKANLSTGCRTLMNRELAAQRSNKVEAQ